MRGYTVEPSKPILPYLNAAIKNNTLSQHGKSWTNDNPERTQAPESKWVCPRLLPSVKHVTHLHLLVGLGGVWELLWS
jgi:hypothetical protein